MSVSREIALIPGISGDQRVRVFRRTFVPKGESEAMEVDAYAITTERYIILCDTLLCPEDMAQVTQEIQDELAGRQLLVIDSHADWDHAWGNGYFTGTHAAPIIAHQHCRARLLSDEARTGLADFQQRDPTFRNTTLTPPTITFTDTLTISGGDLTLELLPAPGHHQDHIAVWLTELRLLLAFDAVENPIPIIENAEAVESMSATLERFLSMQPQRVLCSHGKTTSVDTVKRNLAYLREVEQRGRAMLAARPGYRPSNAELEEPALLINYPFAEVSAGLAEFADSKFYAWAHNHNVRCIMQWLMNRAG
ncbi:MAG TPA: MBL fold metallo-hydrolase [Ktedonosporobacter sp.]|jgi:glyoxylase-like metal-dependent hydrolase (beta-lactamase superfamily II)|nr:MBL fold metallo-hydrolase [Ktedonosporobacter sp.]